MPVILLRADFFIKIDYNIHMNKNHGFTLIELIVTVAMIAIVAITAGPDLGTFFKRNKFTTQINGFVSSLNLARSEAAKRVNNVTVCVGNAAQNACAASPSWEAGWIAFVDTNGDAVIDAGETILNVNNSISGDTTIRSAQYISSITYRGDGTATFLLASTSGTFKICNSEGDERAKAINLMGSGLISQGKKNGDSIVDDFTGVNIACP